MLNRSQEKSPSIHFEETGLPICLEEIGLPICLEETGLPICLEDSEEARLPTGGYKDDSSLPSSPAECRHALWMLHDDASQQVRMLVRSIIVTTHCYALASGYSWRATHCYTHYTMDLPSCLPSCIKRY